jgi:hypothetical protein
MRRETFYETNNIQHVMYEKVEVSVIILVLRMLDNAVSTAGVTLPGISRLLLVSME